VANGYHLKGRRLKTAIDTNIGLDFLAADPAVSRPARLAVRNATDDGLTVICSVVYTELAWGFTQKADLDRFLADVGILVEDISQDALWRSAEAWRTYRRRRETQLICPQCGRRFTATCPSCQTPLQWRQHIITDFLIGGHAALDADQLLTRDIGYYRTYFPELRLVTPG
jgi:predicted nucleic acid-binding protein